MATATYTSTVFDNVQPKQIIARDVTISGQYSSSSNVTSLADVIFLAKIPHGAKIVEFAVDHSVTGTAMGMDYGMASGNTSIAGGGADLSQFASALAKATIIRKNIRDVAGATNVVSVSDNSGVRYGIFGCKPVTGTASVSFIVNFTITYRCT